MKLKWFLVVLGALSFAALSRSQDLGAWTDSYVKGLAPTKHFRGTIVVERDGQVLVAKSHGAAVEEWQIPNSAETKFEIASLSKQFTAAAILQLADAGKLNVEDPVSKYYPDSPPAWKGMTIHHLLTHTSGLPENEWENFYKGKAAPYTTEEQVKTFRDRPLGFPPGTASRSNNEGGVQYCGTNKRLVSAMGAAMSVPQRINERYAFPRKAQITQAIQKMTTPTR
jgi:CubicO group peptidase (beta-lactamase class C family)